MAVNFFLKRLAVTVFLKTAGGYVLFKNSVAGFGRLNWIWGFRPDWEFRADLGV